MVRTYGLTHINLVVRDVERSLRFYGQVFGVEEYGRTAGLVHTRTPGCQDVITFDEQKSGAGESRGIAHFGFRLISPGDIDAAVDEVERAGGNQRQMTPSFNSATPTSRRRYAFRKRRKQSEPSSCRPLRTHLGRIVAPKPLRTNVMIVSSRSTSMKTSSAEAEFHKVRSQCSGMVIHGQ